MRTIEELRSFLTAQLLQAKIYLFGSRAKGTATLHSDVDIAIEGAEVASKLPYIRLAIEESLLPYKVDLVDLQSASHLKEVVIKEGIRWQ